MSQDDDKVGELPPMPSELLLLAKDPLMGPALIEWGHRIIASRSAERSHNSKLPSLPEEIQEWCWHMDTHLTEHDIRHAGLALRAAWPHVSKWLQENVGPSSKSGVPFNAAASSALPQKCVYPEECAKLKQCIRPDDHDSPPPCRGNPYGTVPQEFDAWLDSQFTTWGAIGWSKGAKSGAYTLDEMLEAFNAPRSAKLPIELQPSEEVMAAAERLSKLPVYRWKSSDALPVLGLVNLLIGHHMLRRSEGGGA